MKTDVLALAVYIGVFIVTCNNKCQLVTIPKTGVDTFSPKNLTLVTGLMGESFHSLHISGRNSKEDEDEHSILIMK